MMKRIGGVSAVVMMLLLIGLAAPAPQAASLIPSPTSLIAGLAPTSMLSLVAFEQQPSKDLSVDIKVDGDKHWYASPVWIAIGVIGGAVLLLLIVMAARGSGSTIVSK